ncbi:hypothetical protein HRbin37_02186 [bacterium HR37]|nr:hypothetical protein HRbin37_02186 [bacterium HR37]
MLQIMCWVNPEDYWYLHSLQEKNIPVNYYGYTFEVEGTGESEGGESKVRVMVVELLNANMAVGFALPKDKTIEGEFKLGFICQDKPTEDIPVVCKLSKEVKRTSYRGDDNAKLEFIGFSLEKFYESKKVAFYLFDLRGARNFPDN